MLVNKRLKLLRVDEVPGVFTDHQQMILINHQFLRDPADILETGQEVLDHVPGAKRPVLHTDVFVPAG